VRRLVAIAAVLVCSAANAATLPDVPAIGSRLEGLDRELFQCRTADRESQCRRRGKAADRINDEPVSQIVLFYRNDLLVRSVFVFDEAHFKSLVRQLSDLLGTAVQGSEALKAGMAGVFENRYYVWKRDGRVWFAEQFFERVTDSGLWIMVDAEFSALQAERERMRVHGARDL
jgi:hypothetical protein